MVSISDVAVVGGGVIGLSCALELRSRGADVVVLERAAAGERVAGQASWAAAGMIAVEDTAHPAELRELARWSGALYDAYLRQIARAGGGQVRYQTRRTRLIDAHGGSTEIAERSLDPRELMGALEQAVDAERGFDVVRGEPVARGVVLHSADGREVRAGQVIWAEGAWAKRVAGVRPRKGQMLCVEMPGEAERDVVLRGEEVYIVPRNSGALAGRALIGATVEDVGFDTRVEEDALAHLRVLAAKLAPWAAGARAVDAWSGLRPGTASALPLMGQVEERQFAAAGHFRNGILLAPATAKAMAGLIESKAVVVDLSAFAPDWSGFPSGVVARRNICDNGSRSSGNSDYLPPGLKPA